MSYLQKNKDSFVENKGNVVAKRKQNQVLKNLFLSVKYVYC